MAFEYIQGLIESKNTLKLIEFFDKYELKNLDTFKFVIEYSKSLNINNEPFIKNLVSYFSDSEPEIDFFSKIALYAQFDPPFLQYCFKFYQHLTFYEFILKKTIDLEFRRILIINLWYKLEKVFNSQIELGGIFNLIEIANRNPDLNIYLINFLEGQLNKKNVYKEYPAWVNKLENELDWTDISQWEDYNPQIISEDTISELLTEFNFKTEIKKNPTEIELEEFVKIALAMKISDCESPTRDPDRFFGPINSVIGAECASSIKGGCRMLTCVCHEEDDEWFKGSCDCCFKRLRNKSHALRYPLKDGGWLGEYCGLVCLTKEPPKDPDMTTDLRIDNMESVIREKGIYDRLQS